MDELQFVIDIGDGIPTAVYVDEYVVELRQSDELVVLSHTEANELLAKLDVALTAFDAAELI